MKSLILNRKRTVHSAKCTFIHKFSTLGGIKGGLLCLFVLLMSSCSLVNEDLEPCAPAPRTLTTVNFVYDYNMQYEDLFDQHAGAVTLYVFDENGIMLFREEKSKVDMPKDKIDFSMTFDDSVIKPGNTYNFVAMANGNHAGYDGMVDGTPGFQIAPDVEMVPGVSRIEDFIIRMDRDEDGNFDFGVVNYKDAYGNNQQMIDTVWSTKPDEVQEVKIPVFPYTPTVQQQPDNIVEVTVPMMRLTNSISVNVVHSSFTETMDPETYRLLVYFPNGNGTIDFTGNVYSYQPLFYQTLRKQMLPYTPKRQGDSFSSRADEDENTSYALNGVFGVSRLQMNDDSELMVVDPNTNNVVASIQNFSSYLAHAFDYYGEEGQEFLDREYNFEVDLALDDNNELYWIQIGCSILGWAKRVYYYDLQ